jgi:hypothetical protein
LGLASQQGLIKPVTTISQTAIQSGQTITPQSVGHAEFSEGTLTEHLPFQPAAGATLTGTPLATEAAASFTPHAGAAHSKAPSSILMGGEGEKESAWLAGRPLREVLRLRLGTTLGGRYAVGGTVGEFRGDAFEGMGRSGGMDASQTSPYARGKGQPTLNVLPHGQSAEFSRTSGTEMMHAGAETGFPSTAAPATTAPSDSHPASSSSGGGHH